jgi:predicted dehydrogenase
VRLSGALDGGALMDVGCYCVSAARLVLGEPVAVTAQQIGEEVDVRFTGTLAFAGGELAHFDCGFDMAERSELEVVGERGSLWLGDPFHSRAAVIEVRGADGDERVVCEPADPYACELRDFAAAAGGAEQAFGRADAVGQARAIAALYEAAASGRSVAP